MSAVGTHKVTALTKLLCFIDFSLHLFRRQGRQGKVLATRSLAVSPPSLQSALRCARQAALGAACEVVCTQIVLGCVSRWSALRGGGRTRALLKLEADTVTDAFQIDGCGVHA
jgi:hypothetical protein